MKLTCDRSLLVDKLGVLARGVSTRSALPVLSGILVRAEDDRLDMYSTDMELSIKASLSIRGQRDGEVVVPARLFADVVRTLPEDEVSLEVTDSVLRVKSGRAEFTLHSWPAGDFPQTATFDAVDSFKIGREPFIETLGKVGRAASRDETRPILTGVLMTISGTSLKMVATDSYRLAVKETVLDTVVESEVHAIVPARALGEVARFASSLGSGDLDVAISENQALFHLTSPEGDIWVASRLIDGQFPNYRQLIPETFDHIVTLSRDSIMAAARRVSLLAQKSVPLRLSFAENRLTMRALTQDVGQAEESLDVEFQDESFEIGFSPAYLIDGLDAVDDAAVTLRFTSPLRPGLIGGATSDFVYLIMPIRLSN